MSSRKTILVVDDSPQNIQAITAFLKDEHKVKAATNGERALALASADEQPDLILLDIEMPGLTGYDVCRRLKADPATAEIPVIFLTSRTESNSEAEGFTVGAVDYVHKPFDPVVVRARINTQLALRDALMRAERAQQEADARLDILLPPQAAEEIRLSGTVIPRRYSGVAVMFCDVVNFTSYCDAHEPEEVVSRLDALFVRFELMARAHGLEKIKTIGDSFMGAANLLEPNAAAAVSAIRCGLDMARKVNDMKLGWTARVGVHVGPVVAGVVGQERYQFDIWGDTVNVASRITNLGAPGTVMVTEDVWSTVAECFHGQSLDEVDVKGKGPTRIYQINGER